MLIIRAKWDIFPLHMALRSEDSGLNRWRINGVDEAKTSGQGNFLQRSAFGFLFAMLLWCFKQHYLFIYFVVCLLFVCFQVVAAAAAAVSWLLCCCFCCQGRN